MQHFKTKQTMKKSNSIRLTFKAMLIVMAFGVTQNALSQVTIGSGAPPHQYALLDLTQGVETTKGLLLPRVNLVSEILSTPMTQHVQGMLVYNLVTSDDAVPAENRVYPGVYYNTGDRWERLRATPTNWFYMPSIVINVETSGEFEIDLHERYVHLFEDITPMYTSPGAPTTFKKILGATQIYYYIAGYDAAVFTIDELTEDGLLRYTVRADAVTEATYMNIIFVEKD